jgi:hypothetical protein
MDGTWIILISIWPANALGTSLGRSTLKAIVIDHETRLLLRWSADAVKKSLGPTFCGDLLNFGCKTSEKFGTEILSAVYALSEALLQRAIQCLFSSISSGHWSGCQDGQKERRSVHVLNWPFCKIERDTSLIFNVTELLRGDLQPFSMSVKQPIQTRLLAFFDSSPFVQQSPIDPSRQSLLADCRLEIIQ